MTHSELIEMSPQFRLNKFLASRPDIISTKDNLVGGTVVAELPLAAAGVLTNGIFSLGQLPIVATNSVHGCVTAAGERRMRAQRVWEPVGPTKNTAEIDHLHQQLAAFNALIEELEQQHPDGTKIDALKASALLLSRQIDELRCSRAAEDLKDLLAR
jgi:hypothetical protein